MQRLAGPNHLRNPPSGPGLCVVRRVSDETTASVPRSERLVSWAGRARVGSWPKAVASSSPVANAGTLHGRAEVACGRRDGPDCCRSRVRSLAGSEAASPKGPPYALFRLPRRPGVLPPRRPKTLETASYRKAAAFEYIIRRLDRRQNCAFCRSFRADARTRTEDLFITRFRPVSPPVTGSHLRSLVTPNRLDRR
jgi:hypothetical protein